MMEVFIFPLILIKATWWLITPIILFSILKISYLYHITIRYINNLEWVLLEIRLPQEILKTPKAMEYVLVGLHGVWDELNLRDIWVKGEILPWFSLEIAGWGGEVHFFIYTQKKFRKFTEAQIFSQYPDAEIIEAEDYTSKVPPHIPSGGWDLWGTDLRLTKESPYPLRTFIDLEAMVEEQRLDSIASIAEILNKLGPREHIWIQILITPVQTELREEGEKIVKKLLGRVEVKQKGPFEMLGSEFGAQITTLAGGTPAEEEKKKEDLWGASEFKLSFGEREIIKGIELKTSKLAFETMIRFMYLAPNEVFSKANIAALFGFFRQFNTYNMNAFRPNSKTLPKRSFIYFKKLRTYFRKMRILQWYKWRATLPGTISPYFMLNVEELASIYHFPGQIVQAPIMPRVLSKKAPPPPTLPIETEGE